jgi:hypothetical protein
MHLGMTLSPLKSRYLYSFADTVYDAVAAEEGFEDGFDHDDLFNELANDVASLAKPMRLTALHEFIERVSKAMMEYTAWDGAEYAVQYFEELFAAVDIRRPRWLTGRQISDHRSRLNALGNEAIDAFVPSIFFILYSDRDFLRAFQLRLSDHVATLSAAQHPTFLRGDGVFKRCAIPMWLKQGVFYRDRGRCSHCQKDMTSWNGPAVDIHLDHIVPLASSGTNDPTNFQLMCGRCNLGKGASDRHTPPSFAPYWAAR